MNETIKTFLLEALGVPQGLIDASESLYKKILTNIQNLRSIDRDFKFEVDLNMDISDFNIKKIFMIIDFVETEQVDSVKYYSMSFHHKSMYDNQTKQIISKPYSGKITLSIGIAFPEGTSVDDVKSYFKDNKIDLTTSLAHELKHSYDDFKKPTTSVKNIGGYLGLQRTNFPFKPVSDFLYYMYFIHSIENLVRPSEFATQLKLSNISKKDFYNFITSSEMYTKLKTINNFTYEGFRNSLKNHIEEIKKFFEERDWDIPDNDDELIDEFLRVIYVNIVNNTVGKIKELMTDNLFEGFLGFMGDKEEFFQKLARFASRFEDREEDFYKYEEKNLQYVSNKMMKKISKLYAMANDNKDSIKDWELHQKISGKTNEMIDKDYKYKFK